MVHNTSLKNGEVLRQLSPRITQELVDPFDVIAGAGHDTAAAVRDSI